MRGLCSDSLPSGLLCDDMTLLTNQSTSTVVNSLSTTWTGLQNSTQTYSYHDECPWLVVRWYSRKGREPTVSGEWCVDSSITYTTNSQDGIKLESVTEDYHRFSTNGLTDNANDSDYWHSGWTITSDLGNWTGTITYSDGAANPTFAFVDGNSVEDDLSGTLSNAYELNRNFKNLRSLARSLTRPHIRIRRGIGINLFERR